MKTSRVVWLVLLVAVFVVGASGQEKQRQGERQQQQPRGEGQREPGPPSVEQRFRGAILKAEERLGRIREEVKKPELSEEEEYLLDTIGIMSLEIIKEAEKGLANLGNGDSDEIMEAEFTVQMAQMEIGLMERELGNLRQIRRLTEAGEETETLDIIQDSIYEAEDILDEILELEAMKMELEQELMMTIGVIMQIVDEARPEGERAGDRRR